MRIFPRRMSDSEYIESIRKSVKRRWFCFWFVFIIFTFILCFTFYSAVKLERKSKMILASMTIDENAPEEHYMKLTIEAARLIGVRVGLAIALGLNAGGFGLAVAIAFIMNRRKDSLLLKYYDQAQSLDKGVLSE